MSRVRWELRRLRDEYGITPGRVCLLAVAMGGVWLLLVGAGCLGSVLGGWI